MKTILVPFDFSVTSENAMNYAAHLAKYFAGKVILFHSFHVPAYTNENTMIAMSQNDFMQENVKALDAVRKKLLNDFQNSIEVKALVKEGFLLDMLEEECEKHKVDLIVSGIKSEAGFVKEKIIGSNSVQLAQKCKIPVLIIPEKATFQRIQKIGYACDYEKANNDMLDIQAKYFKLVFNSELIMVNVMGMSEELSDKKARSIAEIEEKLDHTSHQTVFVTSEDVIDGLLEVIEDRSIDVMIVHPHHHSLLEKLVHKSVTKQIAFKSPIPILAVHETKH